MDERTIRRLANLAVGFRADVYPEEILAIGGGLGKAYLASARDAPETAATCA